MRRVAFAVLVAIVGLAACSADKPAAPAEEGPPPMKPQEQERGLALCEGYVARLCACAKHDAALANSCELAHAQPEALKLPLRMLAGSEGPLNDHERRLTETAARKIIASCVKSDAALPLDKCPRGTGSQSSSP